MMKQILCWVFFIFISMTVHAQKKHSNKHYLRPGISVAYLPGWILDDFDGNRKSRIYITGLNVHQEIWKESVLSIGIGQGRFEGEIEDDDEGWILPIKLQKFFVDERKGFNLAAGLLLNFCDNCNESINGALSYEISYLFSMPWIQVNAGVQFLQGALFGDAGINVGGHLQILYQPEAFRTSSKK